MYTNTSATLYRLTDGKYERVYLPAVLWEGVKQSNAVKSGMTVTDSVSVYIPYGLLGDVNFTVGKDILCRGNIDFDFDNASEAAQSRSLGKLRALCGGTLLTVTAADAKFYGSRSMWHYELSLK